MIVTYKIDAKSQPKNHTVVRRSRLGREIVRGVWGETRICGFISFHVQKKECIKNVIFVISCHVDNANKMADRRTLRKYFLLSYGYRSGHLFGNSSRGQSDADSVSSASFAIAGPSQPTTQIDNVTDLVISAAGCKM
ncbi:hypothetical protein HW555_000442 [Spodoptera exigua]|uniref:Uncharacterized protein n=1 Tax=Spodoptera exigua TaxID=7107 RepID=A0A835GVV3_SPOEX|nr:hypothetical protein HW555_000442 [Spodoptera exigua]